MLGSCSGAGGRLSPTEGPLSLVRPFLAAGTPAVIASLGPIEDEAADALFEELVRNLRSSTDDAAEILRRSQVSVLQRRPRTASGALLFQVYGSTRWLTAGPLVTVPAGKAEFDVRRNQV
jgi:CHAT domain-containing protein